LVGHVLFKKSNGYYGEHDNVDVDHSCGGVLGLS